MGDGTETIRPIWRTPLAAALAGWMTVVLGVTLASGRLMEIIPGETILVLAVTVYVAARGGPDGFVSGYRNGVAYRYRAEQPGEIDFPWARNSAFTEGIRFDDTPCIAGAGRICTDRGRPMLGHYSHYRIGF